MAGSTVNCAAPMTIMNTIMAQQLIKFKADVDTHMKKAKDQNSAILTVLKKYIKESKAIRFEGDNYSDAWKKEAKKRGLSNNPETPVALDAYVSTSSVKLFAEGNVFTGKELHAHHDVMLENYILKLDIESRTLEELCLNYVLPSAVDFQTTLATNVASMKSAGIALSLIHISEPTRPY